MALRLSSLLLRRPATKQQPAAAAAAAALASAATGRRGLAGSAQLNDRVRLYVYGVISAVCDDQVMVSCRQGVVAKWL